MSKTILDGIWGDEPGMMLTVIKLNNETGVEISIGNAPENKQLTYITLAPYRVRRLIEVLQKTVEEKPPKKPFSPEMDADVF